MNNVNVHIIGSVKPNLYPAINRVYKELINNLKFMDYDIRRLTCVVPAEDTNIKNLISNCFTLINNADIVIAVLKPDRTFGKGTLYEIEYAKRNHIKVYSAFVTDTIITYEKI